MQLHFPNLQRRYALEITLPPKIIESATDFAMSVQPVWHSTIHAEHFITSSWSRVALSFLSLSLSLRQEQLLKPRIGTDIFSKNKLCVCSHIQNKRVFFLTWARLANLSAQILISLQLKVRFFRTGGGCLRFHGLSSLFSWECMSSLVPPTWKILEKQHKLGLVSSFFPLQ